MGNVKEFGVSIAEFLKNNDEEGAKNFIRDRLLSKGNKYFDSEDLERSVNWWLDETKKAMSQGLFAL